MKFIVLASGSRGNSTYLEIGSKRFLIDIGISLRQVQSRLEMSNIKLLNLDGIFITHEHGDHVSGLVSIAKRLRPRIYMTEGTYKNLPRAILTGLDPALVEIVNFDDFIMIDGFTVRPFMTYHDALEPCGYKFTEAGKTLVYMTDSGYFPQKHFDIIRNADAYIIEANHEPELLLESDRPWMLKKRILDDQGHLSNEDSAFLLINVLGQNTKTIILAHLSQECNTPEIAIQVYKRVFEEQGLIYQDYQVMYALQDQPIGEVIL